MENKRGSVIHENDEHTYYYCVNTHYNGETIQICGYMMAKDEEDAIKKILIREAIEEECSHEILELREII